MTQMSYRTININFDSIGSALPHIPRNFRDPAYTLAGRFTAYAERYRFRYTIFVNGVDLENPAAAEAVRELAGQGHEIANHSHNHKLNLGCLSRKEMESEVLRSHEIITRVCGREPRGFVAPGWSTSATLLAILRENGYLYDTSVFPSYFMWAASIKLWWMFRNDPRRDSILQRSDRLMNVFSKRTPHLVDDLLVLPLPVTPVLRIPCWHTMAFLLPWALHRSVLTKCLAMKYFYYLLHPVDLLDRRDLDASNRAIENIERLDVPLDTKQRLLADCLDIICQDSGKLVTLEKMAEEFINEHRNLHKP